MQRSISRSNQLRVSARRACALAVLVIDALEWAFVGSLLFTGSLFVTDRVAAWLNHGRGVCASLEIFVLQRFEFNLQKLVVARLNLRLEDLPDGRSVLLVACLLGAFVSFGYAVWTVVFQGRRPRI